MKIEQLDEGVKFGAKEISKLKTLKQFLVGYEFEVELGDVGSVEDRYVIKTFDELDVSELEDVISNLDVEDEYYDFLQNSVEEKFDEDDLNRYEEEFDEIYYDKIFADFDRVYTVINFKSLFEHPSIISHERLIELKEFMKTPELYDTVGKVRIKKYRSDEVFEFDYKYRWIDYFFNLGSEIPTLKSVKAIVESEENSSIYLSHDKIVNVSKEDLIEIVTLVVDAALTDDVRLRNNMRYLSYKIFPEYGRPNFERGLVNNDPNNFLDSFPIYQYLSKKDSVLEFLFDKIYDLKSEKEVLTALTDYSGERFLFLTSSLPLSDAENEYIYNIVSEEGYNNDPTEEVEARIINTDFYSDYVHIVEGETSIENGAEIITDPVPISEVSSLLKQAEEIFNEKSLTSSERTGCHINISWKGKKFTIDDFNYTKFLLLSDERFIRKYYGWRNYVESINIEADVVSILRGIEHTNSHNLDEVIRNIDQFIQYLVRVLNDNFSREKQLTINVNHLFSGKSTRRVEFRFPGGERYTQNMTGETKVGSIEWFTYRSAYIMAIAFTDKYNDEFYKKFYKLVDAVIKGDRSYEENSIKEFFDSYVKRQ